MTAAADLPGRVGQLMPQAREDLRELVAIPSVADPAQFPPERCVEAAELVRDRFAAAGVADCALLDMPDGRPAVFGHSPAPDGAPTVLLYSHYDVQPPMEDQAWDSPPFQLTERGGRWYGRGAADCKGNVVSQLTALRALGGGDFPTGVKILIEGAEEQGTGGLEQFAAQSPDLLAADVVVICDSGNFAAGMPTLTTTLRGIASVLVTIETLSGAMHSGMFGGPAPDALIALARMLATLHDERGDIAVKGIEHSQSWQGTEYPEQRFRSDCGVLEGVELIGSGSVADMLWARPAINALGIDCPPVGSAAAIQPRAKARVSMRVPPEMDPRSAQDALVEHLRSVVPWGAQVKIERDALAPPFQARTDGPGYEAMAEAMRLAYGREPVTAGQGGSIPLCSALADALPSAEIMLLGVEEPRCLIHAPNESVDPTEIERIALAQALLLEQLAR